MNRRVVASSGQRRSNNAQFANPTPCQLRALVLDYLCHEGYTDTARAFARDSAVRHLDADGDEIMGADKGLGGGDMVDLPEETIRAVELRKHIRTHILSGRIDDATASLNEHFPTVLHQSDDPLPGTSNQLASSHPDRVHYLSSSTVDPTHLSINLRIQAFVEVSRTVPLPYHPPSTSIASDESPASPAPLPVKLRSPSSPRLYEHDVPESSDAHQTELLLRAQKLYSAASMLSNPSDRATYLKELGNIGGLLAYKVPEDSPVSKYLSQERREAVADQINSAILYRTGLPAVSHLELDARYTSALWNASHELGLRLPPVPNRPPGIQLSGPGHTKGPSPAKGTYHERDEIAPPFDLRHFLDSKT